PLELLHRGPALEHAADRVRVRHCGPRTLDVDIVDIGGFSSNTDVLTVPHTHAAQRAYALTAIISADMHATLDGHPVAGLIGMLPQADIDGIKVLGRIEEL